MLPQLAPIQPPLGPQQPSNKLYTPNQCTLALRQKVFSLSDGDFTVQTAEGAHICKVKGKVFSVHQKKKFVDMQENELFTLSNQLLSIFKSFRGETPDGQMSFEVKGHFKMIGNRSTVHFRNAADGQEVTLEVKGKWMDRKAEITWEGRPVALVSRDFFNARQFFGDQTYFVAVAPNVDLSLIAAICVSLDEREQDN